MSAYGNTFKVKDGEKAVCSCHITYACQSESTL